jgi:pilus assembly protein Flp/PilA
VWGITPVTPRSGAPEDIGFETRPRPNAVESRGSSRLCPDKYAILRFWLYCWQLRRATPFSSKFERERMFGKFLRDESASTAIEYSLIAGFIALAIIAAVGMTGQRLVQLFESLIPALTR